MIPSVRNSPSQNLSVFEAASCNKIFYTVEMEHVVTTLKDARPELRAVKVPSIDELIHTPSEHYNYDKTWAEARTDPIIIAHSSGSTGTSPYVVLYLSRLRRLSSVWVSAIC